ncbi:MAG: hypothetical protein Q8920_15885 [Bacillota bacterium]|nr:hypothetical protein [Bacillota bacterium]
MIAVICFLIGCGSSSAFKFTQVEKSDTPKAVMEFIDRNSGKNGIYLYTQSGYNYIYLNAYNVKQGDKAIVFKDIKHEIKDNTLIISYTEEQTGDLNKKLNNAVIYKFKSSAGYNTIKILKNGVETHFAIID